MKPAELTQLALLGTDRQAPASVEPGSPLGALLAQLDPNAREQFMLSAAALSLQHERAGVRAGREALPRPGLCEAEQLARVSPGAGFYLMALLGGEQRELLPEWLALARQAEQLAPAEALPGLLALGASEPELREAILPVLGSRGRWLAVQNSAWGWPAGAVEDEGIWHTGEPAARVMFLQRLRKNSPGRARELLISTWQKEAPDDRAEFVRAMQTGLSAEDEPFLESALDDKRKEVRRTAADWLGRLPGSALAERMKGRVLALLEFSPAEAGGLLRRKKAKKPALDVTLPAECDKAMQRDGVELKPSTGLGEKAWWLIQMAAVVPLKTWPGTWGCTVEEVLEASFGGEWKKELFEAWTRAAIEQREPEWADHLLTSAMEMKRFDRLESLMSALPLDRREARMMEVLSAKDQKTRDLHSTLLLQCKHSWSAAFSRAALLWLRRLTAESSFDWQLRNQLKSFAALLAAETLTEVANGWPTDSAGWEFWSSGVDELIAAAQFRHDLREELLRQAAAQ